MNEDTARQGGPPWTSFCRNARRIGAEHELTDIGIAGGQDRRHRAGPRRRRRDHRSRRPAGVARVSSRPTSISTSRASSIAAGPRRGDLEEAIAEAAKAKAAFTPEDVHARATRTLEKAILQGTTHMRTHLEVDPGVGLRGLEGVLPLVEGICLGDRPRDLRVPAGGAAQQSRHRRADGRRARPRLPRGRRRALYRQQSARPDRPRLRAGARLRHRHRHASRFRPDRRRHGSRSRLQAHGGIPIWRPGRHRPRHQGCEPAAAGIRHDGEAAGRCRRGADRACPRPISI